MVRFLQSLTSLSNDASNCRCGHCKKLAPIWTQLAAQVQHKLTIAEVNCEAYEGLCRAEGVPGFPQLIYYGGKGQGKVEYTSGRKLEQLRAFAEKVSGPCVALRLIHHPFDPFVSQACAGIVL